MAVGRGIDTAGGRAVAGRGGELRERVRATAIRRSTLADRIGRFAGCGGVVAFHVRAGVAVVAAAGLEVLAGLFGSVRHFIELRQVHRIGVLGARADVGDLTGFREAVDVLAGTDRHRIGAVGQRAVAERDAVVGQGVRIETDGGRAITVGERRTAECGRPTRVGKRRLAERTGADVGGERIPADCGGLDAGGLRRRAER